MHVSVTKKQLDKEKMNSESVIFPFQRKVAKMVESGNT